MKGHIVLRDGQVQALIQYSDVPYPILRSRSSRKAVGTLFVSYQDARNAVRRTITDSKRDVAEGWSDKACKVADFKIVKVAAGRH